MNRSVRTWLAVILLATALLGSRAWARLDPDDARLRAAARSSLTTWHGLPPAPGDDADRKGAIGTALGWDAWAPQENWDPDSSGYDAVHVDLEVEPLFAIEGLAGDVTWELEITDPAITALEFDLTSSLDVALALVDDEPAPFTHADDRLRLALPYPVQAGQIVHARVFYSGVPELGFLWGFDFREHEGVPIVFTNCEPIAARTWWPCKDRPDDKFTADLAFIVPDTMIAASNGVLRERRPLSGNRLLYAWRESYPITTYLVSLTATNFVEFNDTYTALDGMTQMPLTHFAYPEHHAAAMTRWAFTPQAIHHLATLFGEYPFLDEKYGMAEYPWAGAMEHQTLTSMGDYFQVAPQPTDWVVVHELAHQWWGDLVTCGTWRDIWLNEGFATYCEALWAEAQGGPDSLRAAMMAKYSDHFSGSCYDPNFLFNATVYRKGAWVMHMLRHVVGDEGFFAALRLYAARYAYSNAITEDLQAVFEEVTGSPLDWFFDPWVYGTGQPSYRVRWNPLGSFSADSSLVLVEIWQSTTGPAHFKMPLDAVFTLEGGTEFATVLWDSLPEQQFLVAVPGAVADLAIDPMNWVLGKVLFVAGPMAVDERPPESGPGRGLRLGAPRPNPTRGETWIPFELAGNGQARRLRIADANGRIVRHMPPIAAAATPTGTGGGSIGAAAGLLRAGGDQDLVTGQVRWNGCDERGTPVPAGIYFVGPDTGASLEPTGNMARIVILR